jgi:CBS domain-containing protein
MSLINDQQNTPCSEFKMAVAGPLSSFFLAGLFFSLYLGLKNLGLTTAFYAAFFWLGEINFFLAAFNLAPGFPLDGGRILRAAVWYFSHNYRTATAVAARAGQGVAFLLIFFGLLLFLAGNLGGLWLVLIGWFLNQSAVASYQQMILTQALADVHVKEIMSKEVKTVPPNLTLNQLIDDYFLKERYSRFPVVADGHILGVITLNDVKNVPREKWATTKAVEVIEPLKKEMFMKPEDQAVNALMKMASEDVSHLLVVADENQLVGLITRTDIIRLIKIKTTLGG